MYKTKLLMTTALLSLGITALANQSVQLPLNTNVGGGDTTAVFSDVKKGEIVNVSCVLPNKNYSGFDMSKVAFWAGTARKRAYARPHFIVPGAPSVHWEGLKTGSNFGVEAETGLAGITAPNATPVTLTCHYEK